MGISVADPVLFDPWIRFFPDLGSTTYISESLEAIFWGKNQDPGSIREKHPEFAALMQTMRKKHTVTVKIHRQEVSVSPI